MKRINVKSQTGLLKNKKGFSLVETLIALLIFTLAAVVITQSFGAFVKSYVTAKKSQISVENAQYALNLMEKTMRTSDIVTSKSSGVLDFDGVDGNMIKMFDNSQSKCVAYRFNVNKIEKLTKEGTDNNVSTCGDFVTGYGVEDMTSGIIKGMEVKGEVSSLGKAGRISVFLVVAEEGLINPLNVAMTVSLRNYDPLVAP